MKTDNQINPSCTACQLHEGTSCVCLKGKTGSIGGLMVFTDFPDYFAERARRPYTLDVGTILRWMFQRMSIDPDEITYEYTLRCYAQKTLPTTKAGRSVCIQECNQYRFATIAKARPRAIVTLGQTSLEAFTGRTRVKDCSGLAIPSNEGIVKRYVKHIWCGYSVQYALSTPSESVDLFRVLWYAAHEAKLKPKLNPRIAPFKFPNIVK